MTKVTNISTGPRGFRTAGGDLIMLDPGRTSEDVDIEDGELVDEWFTVSDGGAGGGQADDDIDIAAALKKLDPENDDHWTNAGLPAVAAVAEIVGADVTRAQIEAADSVFTRDAAKAAAGE